MSVNPLRTRLLSSCSYSGGTVVYQMCRDIRVHDNEALLYAQELARSHNAQLLVNYVIWNYEWTGATRRFYDWVLISLKEVEAGLRAQNIPLVITFEDQKLFKPRSEKEIPEHVGAVVIDQLPLRFMSQWKQLFLENHSNVPLYEVDAHNCIPVWETSQKQEFAAHTIRGKVHTKLGNFLEDFGVLSFHEENRDLLISLPVIDWSTINTKIICDEKVTEVAWLTAGEHAAKSQMNLFLKEKLETYDTSRNEINSDGQSNLSPYLSHGNIARRRIVLSLLAKTNLHIQDAFDARQNGSNGRMGSIAAFIEETVVRAEISENFCFYNPSYDSFAGFPAWAKETLTIAKTDKREYIYSLEEFEEAKTHDDLWNAAQMQMVTTGKMHGYMRMYWAKKILEWSKTPEDAMKIAVYLNDVYELDGRDSNGYVGCAWSIGGLHDRPWFKRPIFGAVRYMAASGVAKRGKVKVYIEKYLGSQQKLL